ncbi:MAG: YfhO family protein, partial [Clostridia bacterium]|nr:YfhO family protein [Clostridia bacterium]
MSVANILKSKFKFDPESPWRFYRLVLLWSFIVSACITVPFVIFEWIKTGSPIFLYYGDYNAQQICFYENCVRMVRNGDFGWDWVTDMGSNFIGSYSYYMLGSPFFWLMCLFPSTWAPYLMAPMYMVKYIVAALIAYAYLQRFVKNKNYAVIGALLYSFSGFQIYNTFFNQFHDVVAFFPLLLIGIEEFVQNDRKGLFALAVTINALINYFMFAGQVVFCFLYFFFRLPTKSFKITLGKLGGLVIEAVLGFAMSMFIFLPAATALMGNDRISNSYTGTIEKIIEYIKAGKTDAARDSINSLFVWRLKGNFYWQRYGQIFESYFFPPDIPSRVNFFSGHETRWASISMYLPMFALSGVFATFTVKKRRWLKGLMITLVIFSFVPILNSSFFLFNSSYY